MEHTPKANRLHIGIYGKCNSGKSSLVNAITGQQAAVVSDLPGTTTDPVNKSMEVPGLGAVTFIDTAGFDDEGTLGPQRLEQTRKAAERTDVAVIVCTDGEPAVEREWIGMFGERNVPVVLVLGKTDTLADKGATAARLRDATGINPVTVSARTGEGIAELVAAIAEAGRGASDEISITGDLVGEGDTVLLVMPQDAQAPKGRLILPQVQTIRELLDKGCTVISCVPEGMRRSLDALSAPPKLVITDSQAFATVNALTPPESMLTSFSVLFANYKGNIRAFMEGAAAIDRLEERSRVLIAEACTHAPATEDIGRVKIPGLLRKRVGAGLTVDVVSGADFPADLSPYDLVIHCGACMFNRRHVLSRLARASSQHVPMTNYGIAIAHLTGILDRVVFPG
ncbi:MAG TPA: [FeFe] hydrogenase H-cluster maturation GTPase HydF [Candidatus Tidjanibacter gallistercoris]|nr:[FeFe] hydrogenase H-cluster maturation GTPase HydF [Candidatus Tidjanibacter gallistercoris]